MIAVQHSYIIKFSASSTVASTYFVSTMIPPLLFAKIKVNLCSCLASEEDITAMNALHSLNGISIEYHKDSSENESIGGVGRLVSGLFSKSSTSSGPSKGAELSICDSIGGPILKIDVEAENDTAGETRKISLKEIGGISSIDSFMSSASGICIHSKKKNENGEGGELCRFNLKTLHGEDRDEVIEFLKIVIRWNEKRSCQAGEDEKDDGYDDNVQQKVGLGQRALKMKHFAEREIELSKQKRDREARKARYLKDSGGLKYTAVAMANRSMS